MISVLRNATVNTSALATFYYQRDGLISAEGYTDVRI